MRIGQSSAVHFASQVATSVVGFFATLYLANALGPEVLGVYFLVVALVIWLRVLGGLGIQTAVKKRLSEEGDEAYLTAGTLLQVVLFAVVAVVLLLARNLVSDYLGGVSAAVLVGLLGVALAFAFVVSVLEGHHRVSTASLLYPLDRLLRSAIQVGAVLAGYALGGLILGYGVAALLATAVGVALVAPRFVRPTRRHFEEVISFARYAWLGRLGGRAFASMDTVVLGLFVAPGLIGVYEISWNLASILAVFGASITRATFPAMSDLSSDDKSAEVAGLVTDSLQYAGLFLIPGLVGSALLGDRVLAIYGGAFRQGHLVLVVLVTARLIYVYQQQFVNALNAIDRPDLAFRVDLAFIGTNLGLNLVLVYAYGWIGAAVATTVSAVVGLALARRTVTALLDVRIPVREIGRQVGAAVAMGAVVRLGDVYLPGARLITVGVVFVGAAVYLLVLAGLSTQFRTTLRDNLPVV